MADEEKQHAERLLYIYRQRLRYREHQKAKLGDTADPSVDADIAEIRQNIAMLEPVVEPAPAEEVVAVVKRHFADDYLFLYRQLVKFGERVTRVEERQEDAAANSAQWRAAHGEAHEAGEQARIRGQHVRLAIELIIIIVFILAYLVTRGG